MNPQRMASIASRVLVVDDEPAVGALIGGIARRAGFDAIVTTDPADFMQKARRWGPGIIILDLAMPDTDGIELLRHLADERSAARILIISGFDEKIMQAARRLGEARGLNMSGVLPKPIRATKLTETLKSISADISAINPTRLAEGLEKGELFVEYQPKIDLKATKPTGVEALLRWNHPQLGVVAPMNFIPVAEETDLIHSVTDWVLARAFEQRKQWAAAGVDIEVAVNLSVRNVEGVDIIDLVDRRSRAAGSDARYLTLELTESAAMRDVVRSTDALTRLRLKGVSLSIDDFGTGYSSLVQLQRLPFSEIKIDKSFVMECATSKDNETIVLAIIDLAHRLGLRAVAEGVESPEVLDLLTAAGCDAAQGYHFSRPLPADQILPWFQTHRWR